MNPLELVLGVGAKLIDKLFPDPAQKAAAQLKLLELQQAGDLAAIAGQVEINKIEAASPRLFIAGWRPFAGWICGFGLLIEFVVGPVGEWVSGLFGHPTRFPNIDMGPLIAMLSAMIGLGGLRTFEKIQGAEGRR